MFKSFYKALATILLIMMIMLIFCCIKTAHSNELDLDIDNYLELEDNSLEEKTLAEYEIKIKESIKQEFEDFPLICNKTNDYRIEKCTDGYIICFIYTDNNGGGISCLKE